METKKDILEGIGRRSGMTVPEGYFTDFAERMKALLPEEPEVPVADTPTQRVSVWHRVRPYVYMAAMFAGVWLMMKTFTSVAGDGDSIDDHPALMSAISKADFPENYYAVDNIDYFSLVDEIYEEGIEVEELVDETIE